MRKSRHERSNEILSWAREAFAERGYHAVTVDDIVRGVGVARGTFYLYFQDKRSILEALLGDILARIDEAIENIDLRSADHVFDQLRANIRRVVALVFEEPAMMKVLLRSASGVDQEFDSKLGAFYEALYELLDDSLRQGQESGFVREGERRVMLAMGLGGLKELFLRCVEGKAGRDEEAIAGEIFAFLASGILVS